MTTKTKDPKKATKEMLDMIGHQSVEYTSEYPSDKPISYVMCTEGIVEVRKTPVGRFARISYKLKEGRNDLFFKFLKIDPTNLKSFSDIPLFNMILPKIPLHFLHEIIQFFRAVYDKQKTEAAALIRWSPSKQEYYVEIPAGPDSPNQDLSGGGVKYRPDPKNQDPIVMDLHSHHTMSPFFSGTDDGDEQSTQLYAVVGHIECSQPAVNIRARMCGADLTYLTTESVFDVPVFNREWMDTIKKPAPVAEYLGKSWRRKDRKHRGSLPCEWDDWEQRLHHYDGRPGRHPGNHGEHGDPELDQLTRDIPPYFPPEGRSEEHTAGTEVAGTFEEIWEVVENEFYDRPELFSSQKVVDELKSYLRQQMATLSAKEISDYSERDVNKPEEL